MTITSPCLQTKKPEKGSRTLHGLLNFFYALSFIRSPFGPSGKPYSMLILRLENLSGVRDKEVESLGVLAKFTLPALDQPNMTGFS